MPRSFLELPISIIPKIGISTNGKSYPFPRTLLAEMLYSVPDAPGLAAQTPLRGEHGNSCNKAVSDGDMTPEAASSLIGQLEQGSLNLIPAGLPQAVTELAAACAMFD